MKTDTRSRSVPRNWLGGAVIIAAAAFVLAARGSTTWAVDGVAPERATFSPGQETKIADPQTGGLGWYVVYVPRDYTPDREWPTIVCYHGKNNDPKTWPFKEVTDGQGFIIIGMEYLDRERPDPATDLPNLKRIRAYLDGKLRINPKLVFMGGFSQGGWSTSRLSDAMLDELAGLAILGAGGSPGGNAAKLKGKPVFVGIGENDEFNRQAKAARDAYTAAGAAVTFAEWPGLGHTADTKDKALREWLQTHGPRNAAVAALAAARAAEKAGRLGEALAKYKAAATTAGGDADAAIAAKRLEDAAAAKLAEAEAAAGAKKYRDALRLLGEVAKAYAGSAPGESAAKRSQQIQTDPTIKAEAEQAALDAKAAELEGQAQAAERAKDYARAIALYEAYVAQCGKATRFAAVKARLEALKADPAVSASARQQSAERECKGWLSAADSFQRINQPAKAKAYLQKVIDKYGDTEYAAEARRRMAAMK